MIKEFVDRFMSNQDQIRAFFSENHPSGYDEIVKLVIRSVCGDDYSRMDENRIHIIDDGDYQGTRVYVIAANGYQPSDYWYVKISYGSCSGCDTFEAIRSSYDDKPSESQIDDYMTLALHIVQGLKKMGDYEV